MTKTDTQTAEGEKREAPRKEDRNRAEDAELEEAIEESFPASDPPSMTQPETEIGGLGRGRKPERDHRWAPTRRDSHTHGEPVTSPSNSSRSSARGRG